MTTVSRDWPSAALPLFAAYLIGGEFEQAADIGAIIEFDIPKVRGNWRVDSENMQPVRQIERRAEIGAARAYALAAIGRNDESAALMARVLEEAEAANPGPVDPELKSRRKRAAQELLIAASRTAVANIGEWRSAIELRKRIIAAGKELDEAWLPRVTGAPLLVRADLISMLAARVPDSPESDAAATFAAEGQAAFFEQASRFGIAELFNRAPSAESESSFPVIRRAGNAIIRVDNGYSRTDGADPRLQTIRYHSSKAGPGRVEEIGMLAAALYARHDGKDSIIILTRRSITRSVRYPGGNASHEGFETQMVVLLTNANEIPADYAAHAHRVISAEAVLAELEPRYDIREQPR